MTTNQQEQKQPCALADPRDETDVCSGEHTYESEAYRAEIYHDDTPMWACAGHRAARADDI